MNTCNVVLIIANSVLQELQAVLICGLVFHVTQEHFQDLASIVVNHAIVDPFLNKVNPFVKHVLLVLTHHLIKQVVIIVMQATTLVRD